MKIAHCLIYGGGLLYVIEQSNFAYLKGSDTMDILTLSLAAKKALRELGVDATPGKVFLKETTASYGVVTRYIGLAAGKTYNVSFLGGTFQAVCKAGEEIRYIGNLSLFIEDAENTGEVFCIAEVVEDGQIGTVWSFSIEGEEFTVSTAETIHPIDPKFLPGVCLPVVELSTVFDSTTEEPTVCNESDYQKLEGISDTGTPFVCKFNALFPPVEGSNNKKEEQVCGIFSIIKNIAGVAATAFVGTSLIMLNQSADAEHGKIWVCTIINL